MCQLDPYSEPRRLVRIFQGEEPRTWKGPWLPPQPQRSLPQPPLQWERCCATVRCNIISPRNGPHALKRRCKARQSAAGDGRELIRTYRPDRVTRCQKSYHRDVVPQGGVRKVTTGWCQKSYHRDVAKVSEKLPQGCGKRF